MQRAIVLLAFLPALAPAAPAPFPRERKAADAGGWSRAVDGLRVRLVAHKKSYKVGETVRLTLEIQNVRGSALAVEEPYLSRSPCAPALAPSGWAITCEQRVECQHNPRVGSRPLEETKRLEAVSLLAAGETLRIEVRAQSGRAREEKQRALRKGEARQERLYLSDASEPGVYEFRLTFRRDQQLREIVSNKGWHGDALASPPVTIELRK